MQRLGQLGWAMAGLLAVGMAALLLVDVRRASTTGPHWRRRLFGAGLWLLGLLAPAVLGSCAHSGPPPDPEPVPAVRSCYAPVEVPPVIPPADDDERLNRLEERLRLLRTPAESGKLDPEVVQRTFSTIQSDLDAIEGRLLDDSGRGRVASMKRALAEARGGSRR